MSFFKKRIIVVDAGSSFIKEYNAFWMGWFGPRYLGKRGYGDTPERARDDLIRKSTKHYFDYP